MTVGLRQRKSNQMYYNERKEQKQIFQQKERKKKDMLYKQKCLYANIAYPSYCYTRVYIYILFTYYTLLL